MKPLQIVTLSNSPEIDTFSGSPTFVEIAANFFDMEDNYKSRTKLATIAFSWLVVFILFLLCGCSHRTYVPLESVHTDTVYLTRHDSVHVRDSVVLHHVVNVRDSVAIRDSVVITKDEAGNVKERLIIRYRDRWHISADNLSMQREIAHYRASNDSLRAFIRDMQQVPVPIVQHPTPRQKMKTTAKAFAAGFAACAILTLLYKKRRLLMPIIKRVFQIIRRLIRF